MSSCKPVDAPPHCDAAPASEFTKKGVDLRTARKTTKRGHRKA